MDDSAVGIFQIVGAMMTFIPLAVLPSKHYRASVILLGIGMVVIVLGMMKFNLHQAGFMGMLAIAIPSIIAFACLMELITGRHDTDEKI